MTARKLKKSPIEVLEEYYKEDVNSLSYQSEMRAFGALEFIQKIKALAIIQTYEFVLNERYKEGYIQGFKDHKIARRAKFCGALIRRRKTNEPKKIIKTNKTK